MLEEQFKKNDIGDRDDLLDWNEWLNDWLKIERLKGIYNLGCVGIVIEGLNDWTIDGSW